MPLIRAARRGAWRDRVDAVDRDQCGGRPAIRSCKAGFGEDRGGTGLMRSVATGAAAGPPFVKVRRRS
jgi:hypothetical protein